MSASVHPLEGRFVILKHYLRDTSGEGSTYGVFEVIHGRLNMWWLEVPDSAEEWGEKADEEVLSYLLIAGVKILYTPVNTDAFLGQPYEMHPAPINTLDLLNRPTIWTGYGPVLPDDPFIPRLHAWKIYVHQFDVQTSVITVDPTYSFRT